VLAFGIRYLNGFVAAAEVDDLDRAEWPPHPGRVFMALAAAHFQTDAAPNETEALLWLEALERDGVPTAPAIRASAAISRRAVTQFVPVNPRLADERKARTKEQKEGKSPPPPLQSAPGIIRTRQPRTFVRLFPEDEMVFLAWPDVEPSESIRNALDELCAKVTRIGHSSSLVQMWMASAKEVGEPNWVPDEERATIRLRLAPRGTMEYLKQQYNGEALEVYAALQVAAPDSSDKVVQVAAKLRLKEEFPGGSPQQLRPTLSVYQGYAPPSPPDSTVRRSVFSPHLVTMWIEKEHGPYRHLDLACVLTVVQRWREALLANSNDLSVAARTMLSGHDADGTPLQGAHLAFLPLAFVGHEHAAGHLLGMGLALPYDSSRDDRRDVLRAIGHVCQLQLGSLGVWRVGAVTSSRHSQSLEPATWTAHPIGATHWSTVTPIVYDHHPKSKGKAAYLDEVARMIALCCTRVGLPAPREIIVVPVSAHLGVPPATQFPRLQRKDGASQRHTHAILVFDEPVCGPVLLGAGRYRGYGVCRPMFESLGEKP
jgi:CRISPR-associated protein Csb2